MSKAPDTAFAEGVEISLTTLEALRDAVEQGWGTAVARGASAQTLHDLRIHLAAASRELTFIKSNLLPSFRKEVGAPPQPTPPRAA